MTDPIPGRPVFFLASARREPPDDTGLVRHGRPRNPEPSTSVSTWLPAETHDKLIQLARKQEMSVSALVRRLILVRLR